MMKKGDDVQHERFGTGVVQADKKSGNDVLVTVLFDGDEQARTILAERLRVLDVADAIAQTSQAPDAVTPSIADAMVVFPETGTDKLFPADAKKKYRDGKLTALYKPHGSGLLWRGAGYSKPKEERATVKVSVSMVDQEDGDIGNTNDSAHIIVPHVEEFPATEYSNNGDTHGLPQAAIQALVQIMGTATYQSLRTDNPAMMEFFQGMLTGAHIAIGIVCGALHIETDFLDVDDARHDEEEKGGKDDTGKSAAE